ncbi:general secretion pathway protein GspL [Sphingomonas hengshuiensis]|uniref:General secretion pathway protein GspL n=1 Tax=Sphingomonas hengshuiensis TaxID=1609977 RepID=A0A7U5BFR9_9SPHN|nr:general secretion pathway protein GspL [Sphingomonas hengshuiensis]
MWTLAGGRLIIAEPGGPATMLVPTEQVRLIDVDLPLPSRAKRLEALPFAIEDMVAEPVESVHLALGAETSPKRYLVGIVAHEVMARWVEIAESAGLGDAAIVPDALALPLPPEGEWSVERAGERALVRSGAGIGFAVPAALLVPAWESAGRPRVHSCGEPLPAEMAADTAIVSPGAMAARLHVPALDLRQGRYARRRAATPALWRRLGWIVAIGAAAHIVIAGADTLMLRRIADSRAADTRALAAIAAPGANLGEDLAASVADLLPRGSSAPPDAFLPLLTRLSGALAPLGGFAVRSIGFQANTLTMDVDGTDPSLSARIDAALRSARISGRVTQTPDGGLRITARNAGQGS